MSSSKPTSSNYPSTSMSDQSQTDQILRIGNFNIIKTNVSINNDKFLSIASSQSQFENSPQEELSLLYQKIVVYIQATNHHEGQQNNQKFVDFVSLKSRQEKLQAFLKKIESYANQKQISLQKDYQFNLAGKSGVLKNHPGEHLIRNHKHKQSLVEIPNEEIYVTKAITAEEHDLIFKKFSVILKKISQLEKSIGDKSIFGDKTICKLVDQEITGIEFLEINSIVKSIEKLEYIINDFTKFQTEFKKQFLQQDQKKEMFIYLDEFLKEFPIEAIDQITHNVTKIIDLVEEKSTFLNQLSKIVDDFSGIGELIKNINRETTANQEILKEMKSQIETNAEIVQKNLLIAKF